MHIADILDKIQEEQKVSEETANVIFLMSGMIYGLMDGGKIGERLEFVGPRSVDPDKDLGKSWFSASAERCKYFLQKVDENKVVFGRCESGE